MKMKLMSKDSILKRIVIYGSTGSVKTSFAKKLMVITKINAYSLDDIFHRENWAHLNKRDFQKNVEEIANQKQWIIDGNYSSVRLITLKKATLVIILDLQPFLIIWRVTLRTLGRRYPIIQKVLRFHITPLPEKVEESGTKKNLVEALKEFIPKALKFRRKKLKIILKEIEEHFKEKHNKIIILRNQTEIKEFFKLITGNLN